MSEGIDVSKSFFGCLEKAFKISTLQYPSYSKGLQYIHRKKCFRLTVSGRRQSHHFVMESFCLKQDICWGRVCDGTVSVLKLQAFFGKSCCTGLQLLIIWGGYIKVERLGFVSGLWIWAKIMPTFRTRAERFCVEFAFSIHLSWVSSRCSGFPPSVKTCMLG